MNKQYDVCIIGAGAAGLFCAFNAAKAGKSVVVLEHTNTIGKKILISGGGRCNFTNLNVTPEKYVSSNPHFHKSALARYTSNDFIGLVRKYNIHYHEKTLGQLFCDGSSKQIVSMLIDECKHFNVEILLSTKVVSISKSDSFIITTESLEISANAVVVACGGVSIPKMGATDFGLRIAKQFGLSIVTPYPALVPLLFSHEDKPWTELAGVSTEAIVSMDNVSFRENILFTHRGLSGPAILQISTYSKGTRDFTIDLAPDDRIESYLENRELRELSLSNALNRILPQRLSRKVCDILSLNKPVKQITSKERRLINDLLKNWQILPEGTEGFAKAEVMGGGVNTNDLSSKTMEAKNVSGLYFIGEVVDVTGWLGGYNFQWAWSSAFAASQAIAVA